MAATRLPHAFGRYVLRERIAAGGMAEVFRGTLPGFGGFEKSVAIKRMYRQYGHDHAFVEMLSDEAKIVSQLAHPNIVHILDIGRVHEDYYITLEFIEGIDLFRMLQKLYEIGRDMPLAMSLHIIAELCSALDYAHSRRTPDGQQMHIVHRDVSPQNVLISYLGEVKLTDFGIAKARYRYTQTQAGVVKGKLYYMSPEQARGGQLDHRSDLFAAGILLYELLCTRPLYDEEDQARLMAVVGSAEYQWPADKRTRIPAQLIAVTDRALHKNPSQRYQTGREFRSALLRVAEQLGHRTDREQFGAYVRKMFEVPDDRPPLTATTNSNDSTRDYSVRHWASQISPVPNAEDADPPTPALDDLPTPGLDPASDARRGITKRPANRSTAKRARGVVPETAIANTGEPAPTEALQLREPTGNAKSAPIAGGVELPPPVPLPDPKSSKSAPPATTVGAAKDEQEEATAMLDLGQIAAALGPDASDKKEEPTAMLDLGQLTAALNPDEAQADSSATKPAKKSNGSSAPAKRGVPRRTKSASLATNGAPAQATLARPAPEPPRDQATQMRPAMTDPAPIISQTGATIGPAKAPRTIPLHPDDEPASWELLSLTAAVWSGVVILAVYSIMLLNG